MKVKINDICGFHSCIKATIFWTIILIMYTILYIKSYKEISCTVDKISEIEQDLYSGYYNFNISYSINDGICKNKTREYSLRNEKKLSNIRDEYANNKFHCGYDPLGQDICNSNINLQKFSEGRIFCMIIIIFLSFIILSYCIIFLSLNVECTTCFRIDKKNIPLENNDNYVVTPGRDV